MIPYQKIFISILLVFVLIVDVNICDAQPYFFRHYQVEDGLSNNTVFNCIKDKYGFLWMGTKDGLNRFDGIHFKVYRGFSEGAGGADNFIRSLCQDREGNLYIGTRTAVYQFNTKTERFKKILSVLTETNDLMIDRNHNLWIIVRHRLIRITADGKYKISYPLRHNEYITSICEDKSGNIWVSTGDGYLKKWHDQNDTFATIDLFKFSRNNSPWIEKIYSGEDGNIFIGTTNMGVTEYNPKTNVNTFLKFANPTLYKIYVRDILQVSASEIWIATEKGIIIYNTQKNTYNYLNKNMQTASTLDDNAIYCLCKDGDGGVWAGTYFGGVNYYHSNFSFFENVTVGTTPYSLSGNAVREICEGPDSSIWMSLEDGGLNKLNPRNGIVTQFLPSGSPSSISYSNLHGLVVSDNSLVIGTFEHGIDIMDVKNGLVISHIYPDGAKNPIGFFVTFLKTKDGEIFCGSANGLYTLDLNRKKLKKICPEISNDFIMSLAEDAQGNIWIAANGNGLYRYQTASKKLQKIQLLDRKGNNVVRWITAIASTSDSAVWIGTEGDGLIRYNPLDARFMILQSQKEILGNFIYKLLFDRDGTLWITTSKGLVMFDPKNRKVVEHYTTSDGLLSNQFNYSAGMQAKNGKIYLGSTKGLVSYSPQRKLFRPKDARVYISSVKANGGDVHVFPNLNNPTIDSLILKSAQKSFTISFS